MKMTLSMQQLLAPGAGLERLYTGASWSEGPVWLPDTHRLRWSDVRANRILEWDSVTGQTRVFREAADYANGRALDSRGEVVQCSHGKRAIEIADGAQDRVLVDRWQGHRLNSPNDLICTADGAIWFTDPPYGIHPSGAEGH